MGREGPKYSQENLSQIQFCATDATCIGLGLNLGYCGDSLVDNRLNNGTAFIKVIGRSLRHVDFGEWCSFVFCF